MFKMIMGSRGWGFRIQIQQLHKEQRGQKKKVADQNVPKVARPILTIFF